MSAAVEAQAGPHTGWRATRWDWQRYGLIAAWLLILLAAAVVGDRPAQQPPLSVRSSVWGLDVPLWVGWVAFATTLGFLVHLVDGPRPWRATRWAWFWLASNPLGILAYLLLASPTPGLHQPRAQHRMLTGGWAFLIGSAMTTALVTAGLR